MSALVVLTVLDWVVGRLDPGFAALVGPPSTERLHTTPEFSVRLATNALGFRDPRMPGPKPPGTVRVVALGDSFTFGYGVEREKSFLYRLELLLTARDPAHAYEVINLGIPGSCALDYPVRLERVGLAYEPDLVLIAPMANDVLDLRQYRRWRVRFFSDLLRQVQRNLAAPRPPWKRLPERLWPDLYGLAGHSLQRFREGRGAGPPASAGGIAEPEGDDARASDPPPRLPDAAWREALLELADAVDRRSAVAAALPALDGATLAEIQPLLVGSITYEDPLLEPAFATLRAILEPDLYVDSVLLPPAYEAAWDETAAALTRTIRAAARRGARAVLTLAPASHQVSRETWPRLTASGFRMDERTLIDRTLVERIAAVGAEAGVPTIDLLASLRAHADEPLYYQRDEHWTPRGHAVVADALADGLAPVIGALVSARDASD